MNIILARCRARVSSLVYRNVDLVPVLRNQLQYLLRFRFRLLTSSSFGFGFGYWPGFCPGSGSVSRPLKAVFLQGKIIISFISFIVKCQRKKMLNEENQIQSVSTFVIPFITVPVPLRQKVTAPTVPVPVPQQRFKKR
jgi:hypothetical protein